MSSVNLNKVLGQ